MAEDCPDHIHFLRNWNPKTQETRYGTKLPMKILRSKAGFKIADGLRFNPRVTLIPPIELQKMIFPWLDEALESFKNNPVSSERATARHFLEYMVHLRVIILQDATAILSTDPCCRTSLTPNCAWSLDNPLLRGLKSAQNCASLGVRIFLRPSVLSLR